MRALLIHSVGGPLWRALSLDIAEAAKCVLHSQAWPEKLGQPDPDGPAFEPESKENAREIEKEGVVSAWEEQRQVPGMEAQVTPIPMSCRE